MHCRLLIAICLAVRASAGVASAGYDVNNIIRERCCPSDDCYPTQEQLAGLNKGLDGRLILPGEEEYRNQSHMYNTVEQRYPNLIAMVKSSSDIQKVVMFARAHNLHVTVRSSGHDYMGRSTWEGSFLINLSEMDDMEIDLNSGRSQYGTVTVQTGLQWQEIYQKLNAVDRVVVGGSAHTVTPGGYTLGGGHSPVSRSLGYAVDNLLEVQIVLADGSIATCTENRTVIVSNTSVTQYVENGDLFWALRGGGHSFGVVVYFLFRLHPMPEGMVTFATSIAMVVPAFEINNFNTSMLLLRDLVGTMPNEWGGYFLLNNNPSSFDYNGTAIPFKGLLTIFFNKFGSWDGTEAAVFEHLTDWLIAISTPFVFENKTDFWDYEKGAIDPPITRTYLANSLLQPELVTDEFQVTMYENIFLGPMKDEWMGCTGATLGGKTTEEPSSGTSLHPGYRSTVVSLSCGFMLNDPNKDILDQPDDDEERIKRFRTFAEAIRKYGSGMYVNEAWKDNPHWKEDFWGSNYGRLLNVKLHYDPENFFTCHHCVGSDITPPSGDDTPQPMSITPPSGDDTPQPMSTVRNDNASTSLIFQTPVLVICLMLGYMFRKSN